MGDRFHTGLQRDPLQEEWMVQPDVPGVPYAVEVDCHDPSAWNGIVDRFSDASLYQTGPYGEVRWGEKNVSRLVVKKKDQVLAAAQVRLFRIPVLNTGIAYVFYGPMWKPRLTGPDIRNYRIGLRALVDEYVRSRKFILRVRPWGFEEKNPDMESALLEEGFRSTQGIYRPKIRTVLVDLRLSEKDLRARLKKKWRQTLQHSERAGLTIVEGYDERLFDAVRPIYLEMLEEKKFAPQSNFDEFARMQGRLSAGQKMRVALCKSGNGPVSGSLCSAIGDAAIGLVGATGRAGRETQAYYLLQWDEILWSKRAGKSFYDFGGINPVTNPGVYRFKAGMNGEEVTYLPVHDYCGSRRVYNLVMWLERLFGKASVLYMRREKSTG